RIALLGARLDASGDAGGGSIRVGGDLHGAGALANARRTYVDDASALVADAITSGARGRGIRLGRAGPAVRRTPAARRRAPGGAVGGEGGFAEISGGHFLAAAGVVDLSAPAGAAGTLLYDPQEIQLVGGSPASGDGSDAPDTSPTGLAGDAGTAGSILFADVG